MSDNKKQGVEVATLNDVTVHGYSHGIIAGNTVYVAGQCGTDLEGNVVSADFEEQARRCFERIEMVLKAAGCGLDDLVSMTVFITDTRQGRVLTRLRNELLTAPYPTSALIGVSSLMPIGALVEIQAVAVKS